MRSGDRVRFALLTGFGSGLAPFAPGTFGTLPGVAIGVAIECGSGPVLSPWITWGVALALFAFGCRQTEFSLRVFGTEDPGAFVLDEIVGVLVASAIGQACGGPLGALGWTACFTLFRVFDITKLWPARALESVAGAPGIMLDDVAAGVWAGLGLVVLVVVGWI